jgi:DNA-binding transcriptional LysR family regulator
MVKRANLDWNDLRYFLSAAREKTLSGAARSLGVKHSTIGRRISALERSLGALLFVRQPDGLVLTPLGQSVLSRAEEVERTIVGLQALVGSRKQHVRLACPSGFGIFLSSHLSRFQRKFPGIEMELLSGSQPLDLKKGEAELALRIGPIADEELIARKVGDAGWSLYAADAYLRRHPAPADPRQLTGHQVLGYDRKLAGVPGARWIEQHGRGATIVLRSRELTDTLAAARGGLGLAVMPCMLAESDSSLQRLTPDVLGRQGISLVYRREMLLVEPVRTVINFVVRLIRENADLIRGAHRPT